MRVRVYMLIKCCAVDAVLSYLKKSNIDNVLLNLRIKNVLDQC